MKMLGLSSNVPTIDFKSYEIIRSDDAYADLPQRRRLDIRRSDEKKAGKHPSKSKSAVMNDVSYSYHLLPTARLTLRRDVPGYRELLQ